MTAAFEGALEEAGVAHGQRVEEGVSSQRIIDAMTHHDVLVMGGTGHFHYERPEEETQTVARIVKRGVAPTLLVGEAYQAVARVVVAYDGSDPAARTLQRFAQLSPFGTDVTVDLVHVRPAGRGHRRKEVGLPQAASFLRAHGFARVLETGRDGDAPAPRLVAHAHETGAGLIVAGAHSVSAARRLAFGSTTNALLRDGTVPLFLCY